MLWGEGLGKDGFGRLGGAHRRPKAIQAFLEGLGNRGDLHVGS
jgi:hypothetical protein